MEASADMPAGVSLVVTLKYLWNEGSVLVAVVTNSGIPLMPTSNAKARILLRKGRAVIFCRDPFTIRIIDRETGGTQPVEYKSDVGYKHVGISICSEKHEYVSEQRDIDIKETEHHNDARKFRRTRRNRKRYRAPRFNNRKIPEGWLPPSIRHRMEPQVEIYRRYAKVMPITRAVFEMGKFDTQLLKAVESGSPVPQGTKHSGRQSFPEISIHARFVEKVSAKMRYCGSIILASGKGTGQTVCQTCLQYVQAATHPKTISLAGNYIRWFLS